MDERSSTSSSRSRFPLAAGIAILVIALAELLIAENRQVFLDDVYHIMVEKLDFIKHGKEDPEVLVFGDSRYFNINPALVSESLGGASTKNLSWPSYGIDGYHLTLETYLAHHDPPRVIVTHFPPDVLALNGEALLLGENEFNLDRAFFMVPGGQIIRFLIGDGNWQPVWSAIEFQLTPPSAKYRKGIKGEYSTLTTGEDWVPANQRLWYAQYDEKEAFVLFEGQTVPPTLLREFAKFYDPFQLYADPEVLSRFERFLEMARDEDIVVVMLNTPQPEMLYNHFQDLGIFGAYEAYVEGLEEEFPNLLIIDPVVEMYPDSQLADFGHVNRAGDDRFREVYPERLKAAEPRIEELVERIRGENGRGSD